jgi:hypothetical protein
MPALQNRRGGIVMTNDRNKNDEMLDPSHCTRKELEYSNKAKAATNAAVKSAYEATAREYHRRVKQLKERKTA